MAYGNGGPAPLSPEKAQAIAQNYLDSNNWPYMAKKPSNEDIKIKVKIIDTGKTEWISEVSYMRDIDMDTGIGTKYESLPGYNYAYVVNCYDQDEKYQGNIYVNAESGAIKKVSVNKPVKITNTTNTTPIINEKPQGIWEAIMSLINAILNFFGQNNSSVNDIVLNKSFSNGDISFNYPSSWEEQELKPDISYYVEQIVNINNDTTQLGVLKSSSSDLEYILSSTLKSTDYENGGYTKTIIDNKEAYLINTTTSVDGNKYKTLKAYIKGENSTYLLAFAALPENYDYSLFLRILNTVKVQ